MIQCHNCDDSFKSIGGHWSLSDCEHPSLTDKHHEIAVGLMMGDGALHRSNKNAKLQVAMTSSNYLEYLDEIFDDLSTGVVLKSTASEKAEEHRESGFNSSANSESYSDIYLWRSIGHPELNQYRSWYTESGKCWPESITLTPTTLKHWYCGDGCWSNTGGNNNIQFSMANERENKEKVTKIFKKSGLPTPSSYSSGYREDGSMTCNAQFTAEDSMTLWRYMGGPLPDFEYKWPKDLRW